MLADLRRLAGDSPYVLVDDDAAAIRRHVQHMVRNGDGALVGKSLVRGVQYRGELWYAAAEASYVMALQDRPLLQDNQVQLQEVKRIAVEGVQRKARVIAAQLIRFDDPALAIRVLSKEYGTNAIVPSGLVMVEPDTACGPSLTYLLNRPVPNEILRVDEVDSALNTSQMVSGDERVLSRVADEFNRVLRDAYMRKEWDMLAELTVPSFRHAVLTRLLEWCSANPATAPDDGLFNVTE